MTEQERSDDVVDIEVCVRNGSTVPSARRYKIRIDEQQFIVDDPIVTGRQLLDIAGRRPPEEHLVYFLDRNNLLEDISLEESVDLRAAGIERFLTFRSDRSFRFELDGHRQDWGASQISEATLRKLAGVGAEYRVWLELREVEDRLLKRGELVQLDQPGIERFYTGRDDTNAGATGVAHQQQTWALPSADQQYLATHAVAHEQLADGPQKAIVFRRFPLPVNRFDAEAPDILVVLPQNYSDSGPDMFFVEPWLKLRCSGSYPPSADQPFLFAGRRWQRWSRHNNSWRPGIDGIHTVLRRIDRALRGET